MTSVLAHAVLRAVVVATVLVVGNGGKAAIYVSDEAFGNTRLGRAAASTLDDNWRSQISTRSPRTYFERPDVLADEGLLVPSPNLGSLEFPTVGLTVTYSIRKMDGPVLGSLATGALPQYSNIVGDPDWAPKPDELQLTPSGVYFTDLFTNDRRTTYRSAILLEFSTPVTSFGLFVRDLESRPAGRLARLRLFGSDQAVLTGDTNCSVGRECLVPTGSVVGDQAYSYNVSSADRTFDEVGKWGNETTQFVGFYNEPTLVSKALLIVGDEDFGQQGLTEHIAFLGATAVGEIPLLDGDHTSDGVIDERDYAVWQSQYSLNVARSGASADSNGDGVVNAADYTVWRDKTAGSTAAGTPTPSIPEPSALVVGLIASMAIGSRPRG